ncbi:putative membrane protein [Escherichia coli MP021017.5]|nr:putative membrane protein [Escherichia coli MP021017.9]EMU78630.1 putative membrane protein [Escherichia coli MP021017.6]EMU80787.1 putative membrane protein [Escherichia coli MP021017.5]EMU91252.1 putative membrane protein [Escherichia coli MP021017.4]EMU92523.1 putative membrane protein [Escherichia coli MP021017.3]EMU95906.1 putative membrane protein [Escherichia coli MP021017.2]EMV05158.1 putative membrane protein [Escherichia coli MP021017.10]EMV09609.1 putative membrane protein [Esc
MSSSLSLVYTIYILGHIAVSFFGYPLQNPHGDAANLLI